MNADNMFGRLFFPCCSSLRALAACLLASSTERHAMVLLPGLSVLMSCVFKDHALSMLDVLAHQYIAWTPSCRIAPLKYASPALHI